MENSVPFALQRSLPQKAELELSASEESSEIAKCVLCEMTRLAAEKAKALYASFSTWARMRAS